MGGPQAGSRHGRARDLRAGAGGSPHTTTGPTPKGVAKPRPRQRHYYHNYQKALLTTPLRRCTNADPIDTDDGHRGVTSLMQKEGLEAGIPEGRVAYDALVNINTDTVALPP